VRQDPNCLFDETNKSHVVSIEEGMFKIVNVIIAHVKSRLKNLNYEYVYLFYTYIKSVSKN
jgi:hypothetical protein